MECIELTLLCQIVGGSSKMHQWENYQYFLKWREGVFRQFSYKLIESLAFLNSRQTSKNEKN